MENKDESPQVPDRFSEGHIVEEKDDVTVKSGEIDDDSMGEEGHGDDFLGKSNKDRD